MENKIESEEVKYTKRYGYLKHEFFNEKDLQCKGTKFQIIKFENTDTIKPHYHEKTVEIFLTIKGRGLININGIMNDCEVGDIVFCQPGDIHSFKKQYSDWTIAIFKTNEEKDDIIWT